MGVEAWELHVSLGVLTKSSAFFCPAIAVCVLLVHYVRDWRYTTLIADAATGVEDFYSREQIQTVTELLFYPRLCQFFMKTITVINRVCACVRTFAEDDNFPREGGGCVYLMI